MRVALVCPYPWNVPGGVQEHVRDLAETLLLAGHQVSVAAPVDGSGGDRGGRRDRAVLPSYLVSMGSSVPVPYNGSVSRLLFGPTSFTRVRRWLRDGEFDVLHVHSPETLSLSLLALMSATGPIVATFHASNPRSRVLSALKIPLQTQLEKVGGRIAVSPAARKTIVEHLGGDAVLIPNGVQVSRYAAAPALPGWAVGARGEVIGFLGRIDEPRKGLAVLLDAFGQLALTRPALRLLVAGPGDTTALRAEVPAAWRDRVVVRGRLGDADKARFYSSVDVFCAPNLGGESFGIVLLEAMAAGTPVVASDLDAFRRVLEDGAAGVLVPPGDPAGFATALARLLDEPTRQLALTTAGRRVVADHDWSTIAASVVRVYETVVAAQAVGVAADPAVADGLDLTDRADPPGAPDRAHVPDRADPANSTRPR